MIDLRNIHALDHFKRNTAEFRERLKKTGEPEVLTVDGKAELVVQSAEAYQKLLDKIEELDTRAAIFEGLADIEAGRTQPVAEAFAEIRREMEARQKAASQNKRRRA
jgi:PHD/YefM family antitoxin component YafN of YafNO toxin-antitoxin module